MRTLLLGGMKAARERRGSALVLALLVVMSVAALSAASIQLSSAISRRKAVAVDGKRAFYAAEAGLAEAWTGLRLGRTGNVGTPTAPAAFGDALFWVEATREGDQVRLESTGMAGGGRAVLSLVGERGETSAAALGVFSAADLVLPAGSVVDGYDSATGVYAGAGAADAGRIGSNGAVTITGSERAQTTVAADVVTGPDGALTLGENVVHTGEVSAAPRAAELPAVEVPEVSVRSGVEHAGPVPLVLLPGEGGIEFLRVGADAEVVVQGPAEYVLGALELASGASLRFDTTGGPISLVLESGLTLDATSTVETSSPDPSRVVLQVAGEQVEPVRLEAQGALYAVVYAPGREVVVGSGLELFGALVAQRLTFTGPARLHFDQDLAARAEELAVPRLVSWRIVEMSNAGGAAGSDPFRLLGVDRATLPSPAQAHADQVLVLEYENLGGVQRSYSGMESGFDWSDAGAVLHLARDGETVRLPGAYGAPERAPSLEMSLVEEELAKGSSSGELKDWALGVSPLSADQLTLLLQSNALESKDLRDVLLANPDAMQRHLQYAIHWSGMESADLRAVLAAVSPLVPDLLAEVAQRVPPLDPADLSGLLALQ